MIGERTQAENIFQEASGLNLKYAKTRIKSGSNFGMSAQIFHRPGPWGGGPGDPITPFPAWMVGVYDRPDRGERAGIEQPVCLGGAAGLSP